MINAHNKITIIIIIMIIIINSQSTSLFLFFRPRRVDFFFGAAEVSESTEAL